MTYWWRRYERQVTLGALMLDLVPLEECHKRRMEEFHERLDAETVYLRYGAYVSAELRKSRSWLDNERNVDGQDRFCQGVFLNGVLIGIGSIYKVDHESAEGAVVVAREFQGLGRGGETGVGGLLVEDLARWARDLGLERVTAYLPACNSRCERLLRKHGLEVSSWSYLRQEGSAELDLRRIPTLMPSSDAQFRQWRDSRIGMSC